MVAEDLEGSGRAPDITPGGAHFPDCWTAYGATNPELQAVGADPPLAWRRAWLAVGAQLVLVWALAPLALSDAGPVPWLAVALQLAVLCSAAVALVRLLGSPTRLLLRRDGPELRFAFGRALALGWDAVAEIGLVGSPGRLAVGLRLRPQTRELAGPAGGFRAVYRRLSSDFDFLLQPADGDCELLGRALLRYCIDPSARRRLPPGAHA